MNVKYRTGAIELPAIPKDVARFIEREKGRGSSIARIFLIVRIYLENGDGRAGLAEYSWIIANSEAFARAWLDGYTIKSEKYFVLDNDGCAILRRNSDTEYDDRIAFPETGRRLEHMIEHEEESMHTFTEDEIKEYDERYWAFAVPVKEVLS